MLDHLRLEHRFVRHIPDALEPGLLYVSMEYATASHLCCCGCGEEVVTPFSPAQWKLTFDGESVSLHPSVGNWLLPCRSHYVIRNGGVLEAPPWSEVAVAAGLKYDKAALNELHRPTAAPAAAAPSAEPAPQAKVVLWRRLTNLAQRLLTRAG
jgi:hypothetical protein